MRDVDVNSIPCALLVFFPIRLSSLYLCRNVCYYDVYYAGCVFYSISKMLLHFTLFRGGAIGNARKGFPEPLWPCWTRL